MPMRSFLLLSVALTSAAPLKEDGSDLLRDHPIQAAGELTYLDGTWQVVNAEQSIKLEGRVPGDLVTDLQAAGKLRDPYYENSFHDADQKALWYKEDWTYSRAVQASASGTALLVFEGVKMSATIHFDDEVLGTASNQFVRYTFPVKVTAGKSHRISVTFHHKGDFEIDGRWMACSGGWDWAPYTAAFTNDEHDQAMFTRGIWKSVYIVLPTVGKEDEASTTHIAHFIPQVYYNMTDDYRSYPSKTLLDKYHNGFYVVAKLVVAHTDAVKLHVNVTGDWGWGNASTFDIPAPTERTMNGLGESVIKLHVKAPAKDVQLWWPNGMGTQILYNIRATVTDVTRGKSVALGQTDRRIGFKFLTIVTGNDTDSAYVQENFGKAGTDTVNMAFRVNGALMFARGSNIIPMENMEGRITAEAYKIMLRSAADAGMNVFRMWGGGIFAPRVFYEWCDQLGLVIYHDMMYAQNGHIPKATPSQDAELRHQVRRLSHHVSIGVWDGCNECRVVLDTPTGIYATFVLRVVVEEDTSHPVWPSCPSDGWAAGVDRLTSLPRAGEADALVPQKQLHRKIERHGPYQHNPSVDFPTMNTGGLSYGIDQSPALINTDGGLGIGYPGLFASEFGAVVMTSFESLSPNLDPSHWAMYGGMPAGECINKPFAMNRRCAGENPMQQRNYGCDIMMQRYFGKASISQQAMNKTGEAPFKKALYLCMLAQALEIKSNIETKRSENMYGVLVWQLNEIWATGGWGSLEYGGANQPGIVLGGRWKPLHYFYKNFLFQDLMISCGKPLSGKGSPLVCSVKNNRNAELSKATADLQFIDVTGGKKHVNKSVELGAVPGDGGAKVFPLELPAGVTTETHVIRATVTPVALGGARRVPQEHEPFAPVATNLVTLAYPQAWHLDTSVKVSFSIKGPKGGSENALAPIELTVSATGVALYVHLTTLAHGRFSDNSFLLAGSLDGPKTVLFFPFLPDQEAKLRASLRVEHLNMYMEQKYSETPVYV